MNGTGALVKVLVGIILLLAGALVTQVIQSASAGTYSLASGVKLEERVSNICEDLKEVKSDVKTLLKCCRTK